MQHGIHASISGAVDALHLGLRGKQSDSRDPFGLWTEWHSTVDLGIDDIGLVILSNFDFKAQLQLLLSVGGRLVHFNQLQI